MSSSPWLRVSRPFTLVPLNKMSISLLSQLFTIIIIMLSNHGGFIVLRSGLGNFMKQCYQPAYLFAHLLCCGKGYIAQLCTLFRALQAEENPAHSGNFVSINHLNNSCSIQIK